MEPDLFDNKYFHQLPKWCRNLQTKVWFIDCNEKDFPKTLIQVLKLGLSFIPTPSNRDLHRSFFSNNPVLKEKIQSRNSRLTSIIIKCQQFIKGQYLLKETDKNMGPSIISKMKYDQLSLKLLHDKSTFEPLMWYEEDIVKHYMLDVKRLCSKSLQESICPDVIQQRLPMFTGLPKVHKPIIALRPVVNASNCITTKVSKLLQEILMERLCYFD